LYVQNSRRWVKHIDFIILDVLCLILSFFLSYEIRNNFSLDGLSDGYRSFLYLLVLAQVFIIFVTENYGRVLKRGFYLEFLATLKQTCLMLATASVLLFGSKHGGEYSRIIIFLTFVIYFILSYIVRNVWKVIIKKKISREKRNKTLYIITDSERAASVDYASSITNEDGRGIAGLIIIDKDLRGQTIQEIDVVASRTDLIEFLIREWVDEVFIDLNPMRDNIADLYDELNAAGITVHLRIGNYAPEMSRINAVEKVGQFRVLTTSIRVISPSQQLAKRILDIIGAVVGLIITFILGIFVVPAIKIADPGPAIYVSERIGANGRKFKFYKFRSMYKDADARKKELEKLNTIKDGMMFKIDDDPRIIKGIGNFIRKTSIDEFPQFYNVLIGDMSLVGTRPPTVDEWEKYGKHHRTRMSVKPGITGMWQVSGRSDIKDFEEVVKLDNQYINEWNYGLDIKIIIQTIIRVFKADGAK